jgi:hypothetical protein
MVVDSSAMGSDPDPNGDGNPDEVSPTDVTFGENPSVGVAKRAVSVVLQDDGSTNVTYEINVENFGDVNLDSLQVTDDLAMAFPGPCVPTVTSITSDDYIVNAAFDGVNDLNLLEIGNDLPVGDKGAILFTINVDSCGMNMGPFSNYAVAMALSPGDSMLVDSSTVGADPDPNGDGNPDEVSPTDVTFEEGPIVGVAKRAVSVILLDDGSTNVTYEINVENFGDVNLDSLQVTDDLSMAFPGPCVPTVVSITSDDYVVNAAFDGVNDMNLLEIGNDLPVGDKGAILFTVNVDSCMGNFGPFSNYAVAMAMSPGNPMVVDSSTMGSDPDPNGDGNPDEVSPTDVTFGENPSVGVAKRAVSVVLQDDGSTNVTYEINVENFGDVNLDSLQVTDDLAMAFPAPCVPTVTSITSDDYVVNAAFDGVNDLNLLEIGNDLPVGDKGAILFTVNVDSCGTNMGPFSNYAVAMALSPGDSMLVDSSTVGADPDPNGDGNPDEVSPTDVTFEQNASIGIAKRLVEVINNSDGTATVMYEFNIENFGDVILDSIQVLDSFNITFPGCAVIVETITSDDFGVNADYNGITEFELLNGSDSQMPGDKGAILLRLNVDCFGDEGPFMNNATASAYGPDGTQIFDQSVDGSDADPNGDGIPDEMGSTDVIFDIVQAIGIAKNVASAILNNDGSFTITYEFNIENFSSTEIDSIQVVDDLAAAFAAPCVVNVLQLTSDDFTVDTSYNGVTNLNMLIGSDNLPFDDLGSILLEINVDMCGDTLGPFSNQAILTGLTPGGLLLTDLSQEGSNPDPDDDEDPTNNNDPTIVTFVENPSLGVAKRVSAGPELDGDEDYRLTYEIRVENLGDVDIRDLQIVDSLVNTFALADTFTVLSVESEEFTVNPGYDGGITDGDLLLGDDILTVSEMDGAIYLTVKVSPGGFDGPYNNIAVGFGLSPTGSALQDTSHVGSEPDPEGDGPGDNMDPTPVLLACFVDIVCPNVPDTIYTPNDVGWCRAVINLPPAEIITCGGAPDSLIEYMLEGQGAEGIPLGVWLEGQPTGFEYIVGTTKISMRTSVPGLPNLGYSDTCMIWIVVEDKEAPEVICNDIYIPVDDNCEVTITPDDIDAGSTDNCMIDTFLISRDGQAGPFVDSITFMSGDLDVPFINITLQVIDTAGNISYCEAVVWVLDVTDPEIICVDDITVNTEPGTCHGIIPNVIPPLDTTDNCAPVVNLDQYPEPGLIFGNAHGDSIEVFVIATDVDGNMDTCSMFVFLNDNEAPTWLNCPRPPIVQKAMPGMCGAFVNFSLPIPDDNCAIDTLIQVDITGLTSGEMFPVGTTILKYLTYDVAGNVSDTCRIKVIVNDAQPPSIECPDDVTATNRPGACGVVVNNLTPVVDDNCPDHLAVTYEITDASGAILECGIEDASGFDFPVGINTVTYRVQDQPIVLITEIVQSTADALEITNFGPTSVDLSCVAIERLGAGAESLVVFDGIVIAPGETYVTGFVNDIAETDGAAYQISLNGAILDVVATNGYAAPEDWSGVVGGGDIYRTLICDHDDASDWAIAEPCNPSTIGMLNEGLPVFPDNGATVALQSQKPNVATCAFTVSVSDNELPFCAEHVEQLYVANMIPVDFTTDGCAESIITVSESFDVGLLSVLDLQGTTTGGTDGLIVRLISPEGTSVTLFGGLCPGFDDFDVSLSDTTLISVNAATCGPLGIGTFYQPQDQLKAFCGENVMGDWTLQIQTSTTSGTLTNWGLSFAEQLSYAQGDTTIANDPGLCAADFTWVHAAFGDNCCEGTIRVDYEGADGIDVPQGGEIFGGETVTETFAVGTTTVVYTLTDGSGNVGQCEFDVTILDTEPPVVECPEDIIVNLGSGECEATVNFVPSFASDNCEIVSTLSATGSLFPIGDSMVTIIILDEAGNPDTCSFTISIIEYEPIGTTIACNNQIQISLDADCEAEVTADMVLEGDDYRCYESYCIEVTDENGVLIPGNILTLEHVNTCVTVSITDCLGSGNNCWGTICVEEKLNPEIECPADITVGCNQSTDVTQTGEPIVLSCEISTSITYVDEVTDNGECGEPRVQINRTWTVRDESGNATTCTQQITVESFDFAQVQFPDDIIAYSCVDVNTNPSITEPEHSGVPSINGQTIYGDHYCELFVGHWDETLYDANCTGSYSILRHWIIQNECLPLQEGVNPLRHIQNIQVKDNVDPVVSCPEDMIVSTDQSSCYAIVDLPLADAFDACSDISNISITSSGGSLLYFGGSNYQLANLEVGTYEVTYKVKDGCFNSATCSYNITVIDDIPPTTICDEHTIVSLTNDGPGGLTLTPAIDLDDGSYDNCGPVTFTARRMDSCIDFDWTSEGACIDDVPDGLVNTYDHGTARRECVPFSCCDVGAGPVMVELEVKDQYGNVNYCMVEVEVQDKLAPYIECPPNIEVSCSFWFDMNDLSVFGSVVDNELLRDDIIINDPGDSSPLPVNWGLDGFAVDNCEVIVSEVVSADIECGAGLIRRRFIARDAQLNETSCVQRITIVDYDPIVEADITWPIDYEVEGCVGINTDPEDLPALYSTPRVVGQHCSNVAIEYEDQVFEIADTACYKILRTWTVIDWCQYDQNTGAGLWTDLQVLKIQNSVGPTFTGCQDTVFNALNSNCTAPVDLRITVEDDCTPLALLEVDYKIDLGNNGGYNISGFGTRIDIPNLEVGIHRVLWSASDQCGNVTTCEHLLIVRDDKQPTPVCINGISTVVMPIGGEVTIWASEFDASSEDNCTPQDELLFSFSGVDYEPSRIFNCDMIEANQGSTFEVQIWVWDAGGNKDYCTTVIIIDDNEGACEGSIQATIAGDIMTPQAQTLNEAEVTLYNVEFPQDTFMTSEDGFFLFANLPTQATYTVIPRKDGDDMNGVSTLDLLRIQAHLLAIDNFDSPYQYIAADANNSRHVSVIDILELRKLILGIYDELPDNTSWRFVPTDFAFIDPSDPWPFDEQKHFSPLMVNDLNADFVSVKIGDINGTVQANLTASSPVQIRQSVELSVRKQSYAAGDIIEIPLLGTEDMKVSGLQFTLELQPDAFKYIGVDGGVMQVNESHFGTHGLKEGFLTSSWNMMSDAVEMTEGDTLFTLRFEALQSGTITDLVRISDRITKSELYDETLKAYDIDLKIEDNQVPFAPEFALFQNQPNPFKDQTVIGFTIPESGQVKLSITNAAGQLVYVDEGDFASGYGQFILQKRDIAKGGFYYYRIESGSYAATKKMIHME